MLIQLLSGAKRKYSMKKRGHVENDNCKRKIWYKSSFKRPIFRSTLKQTKLPINRDKTF